MASSCTTVLLYVIICIFLVKIGTYYYYDCYYYTVVPLSGLSCDVTKRIASRKQQQPVHCTAAVPFSW